MMDAMTNKSDEDLFMQIAEEKHREALELEQNRLTDIFQALDEVVSSVDAGNKLAMLKLLEITADSLRAFEVLPQGMREVFADGLAKMRGSLEEAKGFLPRGRGGKKAPANKVFATAGRVELYRFNLGISLDDAEIKVAEEYGMKQDLVHKYWKQSHRDTEGMINALRACGRGKPFLRKKKVR